MVLDKIKKIIYNIKKWSEGSPPPNYFGQNNKKVIKE
tara:strand:+ start:289 stop:399 length:111 start_codon:yes stop_codon:yes gene_type:complete